MISLCFLILVLCYFAASENSTNNAISPNLFSDCAEATKSTGKSGVYNIKSSNLNLQFKAYCMVDPNGGSGWTVIQRRQDGSVNFNRNWTTYETGFGNLNAEHFLGLKTIHALNSGPWTYEFWIQLGDWQNHQYFAKYGKFYLGAAVENYPLKVSKYTGDAGDQFMTYSYFRVGFSTYDNDNDQEIRNCAKDFEGGWWYRYCPASNLNGLYKTETGISWHVWGGPRSLKYSHMAIRPTY